MLRELFLTLVEHAKKANEVRIYPFPGDSRRAMVCNPNGDVVNVDLEAPLRRIEFGDLTSFASFVDSHADAMVFLSAQEIVAWLDKYDRREYAFLLAHYTRRWSQLEQLGGGSSGFSVRELVRFLALELGVSAGIVSKFRRIDFTRTSSGKNHVEHGRESLGRSVESAVQQVDELPEELRIDVDVLNNRELDTTTTAVVRVFVNHDEQKIELRTVADELESAKRAAMARALQVVQGAMKAPVYLGKPTPMTPRLQ